MAAPRLASAGRARKPSSRWTVVANVPLEKQARTLHPRCDHRSGRRLDQCKPIRCDGFPEPGNLCRDRDRVLGAARRPAPAWPNLCTASARGRDRDRLARYGPARAPSMRILNSGQLAPSLLSSPELLQTWCQLPPGQDADGECANDARRGQARNRIDRRFETLACPR